MDFKELVKEQRAELETIETGGKLVERGRLNEGKRFLKYPNILAVTGVRRCGKSIFSYLLAKGSRFGYINFDDERMVGTRTEDLDRVLQAFYELYGDVEYVILDEIQNVPGWELFANRLRRTKKVILTGSNSRLLAGELATHLTGRHIDLTLFPFSFREFLDSNDVKTAEVYTTMEKAEILKFLNEYLEAGGFPETKKFGRAVVSGIYNDIIMKDILLRYKIKKKEELRKLANYLVTNFSREITYSRLARAFGVRHVSTMSNWVSYLADAFLILKLERYTPKLKQQFIAPKKVYCVDTGIINLMGFRSSENSGRLMENCVAIELQRRKSPGEPDEIYYWKDHQQNEVDFVVKGKIDVKQLIQVTYASGRDEIKEREIDGLMKASAELKCDDLSVITWDYESEEKSDGKLVRFIPLWKWLLEKNGTNNKSRPA